MGMNAATHCARYLTKGMLRLVRAARRKKKWNNKKNYCWQLFRQLGVQEKMGCNIAHLRSIGCLYNLIEAIDK